MGKWRLEGPVFGEGFGEGETGYLETTIINGAIDGVSQELNGHEEATFTLVNNVSNRMLVSNDLYVDVIFDDTTIFQGFLSAVDYSEKKLKCVLYNKCFETMKRRVITGTYWQTAANVVFAEICAAAGVNAGICPNTTISVRFDRADCFDAAEFIAVILNKDYWSSGTIGFTFNIGVRGIIQSLTKMKVGSRNLDRSKKRDKVIVRGIADDGSKIYGEAGTGTNVAVVNEKKAADKATLNLIAAKYLADLNTNDVGVALDTSIGNAYNFYPGDTIPISKSSLYLDGNYRIKTIRKKTTQVEIEVDKPKDTVTDILNRVKSYEEIGIYLITQMPPICAAVSDIVRHSNDAVKDTRLVDWTKIKEIHVDEDACGEFRIKYTGQRVRDVIEDTVGLRIYINGSAVGAERTINDDDPHVYSENFGPFGSADLIQIYGYGYGDPEQPQSWGFATVGTMKICYTPDLGFGFTNQDP